LRILLTLHRNLPLADSTEKRIRAKENLGLMRIGYRCLLLLAFSLVGILCRDTATGQEGNPTTSDPMLAMLQRMVAENPRRADTWRLLGRIHRKQNETGDAVFAFKRAIELQPDNIAAHADFAEFLDELGNRRAADFHYDQVMKLGPTSSYAQKLVSRGIRRPPQGLQMQIPSDERIPNTQEPDSKKSDASVTPAAYEIQTFDGALKLERRLNDLELDTEVELSRFRAFIETGALYNSNVTLTPISRELTGDGPASFQGFFSPDVEWIAFQPGPWKIGPLARGYFTLNESNYSSLDLASFQPGAFVERDLDDWSPFGSGVDLAGRVEYTYGLDLLAGNEFGRRHSLTSSLTTILPDMDVIYSYLTTSFSDFADDGADPSVDSLDGYALSTGTSRFFSTDWTLLPKHSLGADVEWANTRGADYRYLAISLYGDATLQLTEKLSLIPRAGIGYRHYPDFTGTPNRDEITFRISGKLRWQLNQSAAISAVVGYDRFASENEDFDASRTEAGLVLTFLK
jgi:tetratricopeptide (TPR) repeat protein